MSLKKHTWLIIIASALAIALLGYAVWDFSRPPVPNYSVALPNGITLTSEMNIANAAVYLMETLEADFSRVSFVRELENTTFQGLLDFVRDETRGVAGFGFTPALVGTDVQLIGQYGATLYVAIAWNPSPDLILATQLVFAREGITERIECDILILALTSIPGIEEIQFVIDLNKPTGSIWETLLTDLSTPRGRDRLLIFDYTAIGS